MLWVRGWFWIGEVLLILNLFNLTSLYFRHSKTPLFVHLPVVSAPYAWNYVAILWDGAAAVNATSLPARILANIVIWGILVLGAFFVFTFKDYTMGFSFAVLSLCKCRTVTMQDTLLTEYSAGSCATGYQGRRTPVDLRLRHHGNARPAFVAGVRSWTLWRERRRSTGGCYRQ
jgi:hypothetical protein